MAHFEECEEDYCKCEEHLQQEVTVFYDPTETNSPQ